MYSPEFFRYPPRPIAAVRWLAEKAVEYVQSVKETVAPVDATALPLTPQDKYDLT